jgi:hypothetical protein
MRCKRCGRDCARAKHGDAFAHYCPHGHRCSDFDLCRQCTNIDDRVLRAVGNCRVAVSRLPRKAALAVVADLDKYVRGWTTENED